MHISPLKTCGLSIHGLTLKVTDVLEAYYCAELHVSRHLSKMLRGAFSLSLLLLVSWYPSPCPLDELTWPNAKVRSTVAPMSERTISKWTRGLGE